MTAHPLDRPVWTALTSRHAGLAEGSSLARRYRPGVAAFAASRDDGAQALAALGRLVGAGERLFMLQADAIALPDGVVAAVRASGVQMLGGDFFERPRDPRIIELGPQDAAAMLALAELTRPGPFTLQALALGRFWGVRIGGRLAAMAGERMKQDGFCEISGVATHPDFRGQGLARLLSLVVAAEIRARGETPYLHAYAENAAAIRLYQSIGFVLRREMNVAVIARG